MSIPNKQIGWSNESNLLWQIAKQLERLTGVTSKISGSGGSATVVTKAQVDALIASNSLVPGSTYIITGVDVPLYGGTTIMLQAETTNKLTLAGHGIFYNPKYQNSQLTPNNGYGIWSNYITLNMSSIVGTFTNGETVTANNGATATYLAKDFLSWISGDWSAATSISNGSGATANVGGGVSPSYAIGQDVIWGGKHWTNTSGNVGTADDKYTLSSADWTAVPFNSTDYNVVADVIHYDYEHDMIIRRKDKWNNDVDGNFQVFTEFISPDGYGYGNPIKDFQWGNGPEDFNTTDYYFLGVQSNLVKDSYFECINFIGEYLWFNTLTQQSYMHNNITDTSGYISGNTLSVFGGINGNTLSGSSIISGNTLSNGGSIYSNTLSGSSIISGNTLSSGGYISGNTLSVFGGINNNTLSGFGSIDGNTLSNGSGINGNTLTNSNINNNTLSSSGGINGNTLTNSLFDFSSSGTLTLKIIRYIEASYVNATFNISAATIIYGSYSKQMFRNSAGVTRLGYYNGSDVFTVVNVNA
jgi:hypothetical protein